MADLGCDSFGIGFVVAVEKKSPPLNGAGDVI